MNPFDLMKGSGPSPELYTPLPDMLLRLLFASALAAFIAYRPWRLLRPKSLPPSAETAQAQIIIAVAGAVMVIIIGDSTARAFGLVGLGAFIRFRSGIKDPRDAAVMFVMIGIGMAVGLGLHAVALLTTCFVAAVLTALDASGKVPTRRMRIGIDVEQPGVAVAPILPVFPGTKVLEAPSAGSAGGRLLLEIDATENLDAASVLAVLEKHGIGGVRGVSVLEE